MGVVSPYCKSKCGLCTNYIKSLSNETMQTICWNRDKWFDPTKQYKRNLKIDNILGNDE